MKRYIHTSDDIISDRQVLKLRFASHNLGAYAFLDDDNTRYIYDRGTFNHSKFAEDIKNIIYNETDAVRNKIFVIKSKTKMRVVNGIPLGTYELISPTLVSVEDR